MHNIGSSLCRYVVFHGRIIQFSLFFNRSNASRFANDWMYRLQSWSGSSGFDIDVAEKRSDLPRSNQTATLFLISHLQAPCLPCLHYPRNSIELFLLVIILPKTCIGRHHSYMCLTMYRLIVFRNYIAYNLMCLIASIRGYSKYFICIQCACKLLQFRDLNSWLCNWHWVAFRLSDALPQVYQSILPVNLSLFVKIASMICLRPAELVYTCRFIGFTTVTSSHVLLQIIMTLHPRHRWLTIDSVFQPTCWMCSGVFSGLIFMWDDM